MENGKTPKAKKELKEEEYEKFTKEEIKSFWKKKIKSIKGKR